MDGTRSRAIEGEAREGTAHTPTIVDAVRTRSVCKREKW
jgi:hypothetical protein